MLWHYCLGDNYSVQSLICDSCDMFDIKTIDLYDDYIITNKIKFYLMKYTSIVFTWNLYTCSIDDINKMLNIENTVKKLDINMNIINSPSSYIYIHYKHQFYSLLSNNGYSSFVPKNKLLSCICDLFINSVPFPKIIRSDISSGGIETFLSYNYIDLVKCYRKINDKKHVIIIEYINNHRTSGYYCSYRVFMCNNKIYFAYPHVSTKQWCAHTNPEGYAPDISDYLHEYDIIINKIAENRNLFIRIQNLLQINHLALDVLLYDGKIFFCEPELKYGIDDNYKRQLEHYNLEFNFMLELQKKHFEPLDISDFYTAQKMSLSIISDNNLCLNGG